MDEESLADVMHRLSEDGALDDERFARRYAEDKREISGWGPERIRQSLRERGLDDSLIEEALASESRDEQLARAFDLLHSREVEVTEPDQRRKALGLLARRGFDSEVAYDALREYERSRRDSGERR